MKTVAILGAGRLGSSLGKRLVECGYRVLATRKHRERLGELKRLGLEPVPSNVEAAREADVVIISVKPWDVESVALEVRGVVEGKVVVSVAAGVKLATLSRLLPGAIVYRAMPNLGVEIGLSLTALAEKRGSEHDMMVENLFRCVGEVFWVKEELIPAWTGIAGSGPGLLASIGDAILLAAVAAGIPAEQAERMVAKLLEATGRLVERYGLSGLRNAVATPGGTTIAGLSLLEKGARGGVLEAFLAAVRRAVELENKFEHDAGAGGPNDS